MNSKDIRLEARDALKGNWLKAIVASIVASFFGASTINTVSTSVSFNFDTSVPPEEGSDNVATAFNMMADYEEAWAILLTFMLGMMAVAFVYAIIMFTVGSAVSVGYCQFNLDLVEGGDVRIGDLFSRFSQLKAAIFVKLLTLLRVTLGYILFIIPGVIMTYSYSMANFVLADNPEMTAKEALAESKRIMKGHRWKLFCLEFSFYGWILLSVLTLGIGLIWVLPYYNAAHAAFYLRAKNEADYAF